MSFSHFGPLFSSLLALSTVTLLFVIACEAGYSATTCKDTLCDGLTACTATSMGFTLRARVGYTDIEVIKAAFLGTTGSNSTNATKNATALYQSKSSNASNLTVAGTNMTVDMTNYIEFYGNYCRTSGAGFCPVVDDFAAVKLGQRVGEVARCHGMAIEMFSYPGVVLDRMLYVQDNVAKCNGINSLGRARADMLIFNITLDNGKLKNQDVGNNQSVLVGTGFVRTCDKSAICTLDAALPCIGGDENSGRNGYCGVCLDTLSPTTSEASDMDPNIYLVFYGTDSRGYTLTSGGKNPLVFREYSMGNVYDMVMKAKSKIPSIPSVDVGSITSQFSIDNLKSRFNNITANAVNTLNNLPSTISNLPTPGASTTGGS